MSTYNPYTWTNSEPCPRCGSTLIGDGPEFGSDSYDSYSWTVEVCKGCGLYTGLPWNDGWYVYVDPGCASHEEYDPENPEHAEFAPGYPWWRIPPPLKFLREAARVADASQKFLSTCAICLIPLSIEFMDDCMMVIHGTEDEFDIGAFERIQDITRWLRSLHD